MPVESVDCRRRRGSSCDDELALVKAAAWAWFQHGSANESKATREFDLARKRRQHRPSRYKLEAVAAAAAAVAANVSATSDHLSWAAPSPTSELSLLDPYEVDRISKQLDRLVASTRRGGSGRAGHRRSREAGKGAAKVSGFWLRHAVGLCGSRADAAEARALVGVRRSPCFRKIDESL
ncbi:hypothetical protein Taro_036443 [Colocasia esculenta]|uniref:Uncharacterized protein n=1 Tax=Colocasia esculenta TaxID=4460 RepID=A0A843W336_COLES|nr:hypothetical protein [Colocasia esculenta]